MPHEKLQDTTEILAGLEPTADVSDRINALKSAGLTYTAIAYAVGVRGNAICNWRNGEVEPRQRSVRKLDNLRHAAHLLIVDGEMEPEAATMWLGRKKESDSGVEYPILDAIRENPDWVLERMAAIAENHS